MIIVNAIYIPHRRGRAFNPLIFFSFSVIILLYWFVTKNIGNYRKYDIFFNFRFTENMIFPSNAENHENMIFKLSVFMKTFFFHAVILRNIFCRKSFTHLTANIGKKPRISSIIALSISSWKCWSDKNCPELTPDKKHKTFDKN